MEAAEDVAVPVRAEITVLAGRIERRRREREHAGGGGRRLDLTSERGNGRRAAGLDVEHGGVAADRPRPRGRAGDGRRGITATAVCSVSDSPPSLLVCVNRDAATCAAISATGRFSVQLLDDTSDHIALAFAGRLQGADKFGIGDWCQTAFGQPRLLTALACLSCRVLTESDSGSHRIFVGGIEDAILAPGDALVYAQSRFHRLQAAG